jgi:stage IV sporulation protein A
MENFHIIKDIAQRTAGDIYLGVVGPVRTGKSTFIKRFMELLVLPNIKDHNARERALDEIPQSGAGRTIMTSEPKFIPAEAAALKLGEGLEISVRLADCVGYAVPGALGFEDEEGPRMVSTPWFEEPVSFQIAAETGTRKVIEEHSTIGIVIISDGLITDIARENYLEAEERVINELKGLNKPFTIILNCRDPKDTSALELAKELTALYGVKVLPANVSRMSYEDLSGILSEILYEFPISEVNITLPRWVEEIEADHWLRRSIEETVENAVGGIRRVRDIESMLDVLGGCESIASSKLANLNLGTGMAAVNVEVKDFLFNKVLGEYAGREIEGEHSLLQVIRDYSRANREWGKVAEAMEEARRSGYGVVTPSIDEMYLEEPDLIRHGGRFGVKMRASAPSFHIIRANIATEITPLFGTEKQCEDLVRYILSEFEDDPQKLWNTNIFGKSLHEVVREGIQGKIYRMPDNAQEKLQETLQRIVNDGGGGIICIVI